MTSETRKDRMTETPAIILINFAMITLMLLIVSACMPTKIESTPNSAQPATVTQNTSRASEVDIMKKPLVTHMYIADPSAHVFEGKLYIRPLA